MVRVRLLAWLLEFVLVAVVVAPLQARRPAVTVEAWRGVSESSRAMFEDAIAIGVPIMQTQLGLELREAVRYVVFPDRAGMLEGFASLLGYTRERAQQFIWPTGLTIRDRTGTFVFTRLDGFGRAGPDRATAVRHAAHELTHVVQRGAKLCPTIVPSWITEGWAEWAGFRVVDLAGVRSYTQQRAERIDVMRQAWDRTVFPTLVQLDRQEWARLVVARGAPATYGIALLGAERLVERPAGHPALDAYCLAVRADGRWVGFERTFGQSEPDFAFEFLRYVQTLMGQ